MQQKKKRRWIISWLLLTGTIAIAWTLKDDVVSWYYARRVQQELKEKGSNRMNNPANLVAVDSGLAMLRNGDLVLRTGADIISYMLCQLNQENKTYSHCGLVVVEHGYPFIYHCIGGEDNPDEKLRRDSASFFFSPAYNRGFGIARFDADSIHLNKLQQVIRRVYKEGHKFDLDFDLQTDDKLYCAEFVYKAVDEAMDDPTYIIPTTKKGFTFVGVDNLFCNRHTHLVWQIEYK